MRRPTDPPAPPSATAARPERRAAFQLALSAATGPPVLLIPTRRQRAGGAHLLDEAADRPAQPAGDAAKILGDRLDLGGVAARTGRFVAEIAHRARRLDGALCGDFGAACDLKGRGALLGDCR